MRLESYFWATSPPLSLSRLWSGLKFNLGPCATALVCELGLKYTTALEFVIVYEQALSTIRLYPAHWSNRFELFLMAQFMPSIRRKKFWVSYVVSAASLPTRKYGYLSGSAAEYVCTSILYMYYLPIKWYRQQLLCFLQCSGTPFYES
jgi:hypothetical protein